MENESTEMTDFVQEFVTRTNEEEDEAIPTQMSIFDMEVGINTMQLIGTISGICFDFVIGW